MARISMASSLLSVAVLLAEAATHPLLAQCAMCKTSVAAASNTDHISRILHLGILALLLPAVLLFIAIFILMSQWRDDETELEATADREPAPEGEAEGKSLRRGWLDALPTWNG